MSTEQPNNKDLVEKDTEEPTMGDRIVRAFGVEPRGDILMDDADRAGLAYNIFEAKKTVEGIKKREAREAEGRHLKEKS